MAECRTNSPTNMCKTWTYSPCVVYLGPNLTCIDVNTNERLDEILSKIDAKICTSVGTGTVTSFSFTDNLTFSGVITNPTTTPNLTLTLLSVDGGTF